MQALRKSVFASLNAFGFALALFALCSPKRTAAAVCMLGIFFILGRTDTFRKCIGRMREFAARNSLQLLLASMLFTLLVRFAYAFAVPDTIMQNYDIIGLDYVHLWNGAGDFAAHSFPENKSWATVVIYGFVRCLFGDSLYVAYAATALWWCITIVVIYLFVKRCFGAASGALAACLLAVSPIANAYNAYIATEHMYSLFLALSFLLFDVALSQHDCRKAAAWAIPLGASIWCCCWSRGEGVLLWIAIPAVLVASSIGCKGRGLVRMSLMASLLGVFAVGALFAIQLNVRKSGTGSVFCSVDNYWPRLFGSSVEHGGAINGEDKDLIVRMWSKDHPGEDADALFLDAKGQPLMKCPLEFVPYISAVIAERWSNMGIRPALAHIVRKWNVDVSYEPTLYEVKNGKLCVSILGVGAVFYAFVLLMAICFFAKSRVWGGWSESTAALILFAAGNLALLAVAEAAPRYGWGIHLVLLPFAAAGAAACRSPKCE